MNLSRSEIYTLMKMVESAIEENKKDNLPLNKCRHNPAVDMVALLYILQDAYMAKIHASA
jgi:transposase